MTRQQRRQQWSWVWVVCLGFLGVTLAGCDSSSSTSENSQSTTIRVIFPQEARLWGSSEDLKALDEAARTLADFPRQFPNSPYAPAIVPVAQALNQTRGEAEKEGRLQALKGQPAPEFKLKDLDGKEQTLGAYRGKLILLNFFASW